MWNGAHKFKYDSHVESLETTYRLQHRKAPRLYYALTL